MYQCTGCESLTLSPLGRIVEEGGNTKYKLVTGPPVGRKCRFCRSPFHVGGPIWIDPIHDQGFVQSLLQDGGLSWRDKYGTADRMVGMLSVVAEELPDVPLYYSQDRLFSMVKLGSTKFTVIRYLQLLPIQ